MRTSFILSTLFLLIVLALAGCNDDQPLDDGLYNVSGRVENIKLTDAPVKLELSGDQKTHAAQVDAQGNYQFAGITAGDYTLQVSQTNAAGNTVERTLDITISDIDQILNVVLPTPVTLVSSAHTADDVTLNWTLCTDSAFREYKVYQGYTPGLDETTGTLIYVSTNAADTTFVDTQAEANMDYYYRTYIMDSRGRLAGSNVLKVRTSDEVELYTLTPESNYAVSGDLGEVNGVAFDGTYIWLARRLSVGGYYDNDVVTLQKYDATDMSLAGSFTYTDRYDRVTALTYDGQYLWLQHSEHTLFKIDPATGTKLNNYITDTNSEVWGLAYFNNELYLSYPNQVIEKWNPATGSLISTHSTEAFADGRGNSFGVAVRPGEIWLSARLTRPNLLGIAVFNDDFTLKGLVENPSDFSQLCFVNDKLLIATPNRLYFYTLVLN